MLNYRSLFVIALFISSCIGCVKDTPFLDVSSTQPIIEFSFGTNGESDLGNFGVSPSMTVLDTAIAVNIASPQVLDYAVTVTIKVDSSFIAKYNSVSGNTQLALLPDSAYNYTTTSVTIPAGHRIARIPLKLYPSKIDLGTSYGLPIAIVSATGSSGQSLLLSGNAGVAFYAFIGNPLAGQYDVNGTRYNYVGSSGFSCGGSIPGTYSSTVPSPTPKLGSALDPTKIALDYANLGSGGYQYEISIDPNDPTNLLVNSNTALAAALSVTYCTHTYDPVLKTIHIISTYTNGAGNDRVIDETFVHQ